MKRLRLLIAIFLSFCIMISFSIPSSAVAQIDRMPLDNDYYNRVLDFIEVRQGERYTVDTVKNLFSNNDNVVAYCYLLDPYGYVIIDKNCEVVEATFETTASYYALNECSEKIYYGGPLSYFRVSKDEYIDIMRNKNVKLETAENLLASFSNLVETNGVSILTESENHIHSQDNSRGNVETTRLSGTLRTYSYNPNKICGSTAAAILLMYYRDYRDSYMVPSWHATSDGVSLIELLMPQINGDYNTPASCADVVRGLNYYFRWRGISNQYSATHGSGTNYTLFKSLISQNKPIELLLIGAPGGYGDHFVVAHTLEREVRETVYYFAYVGDGWGNNNVLFSFRYIVGYVYING